MCSIIDVRIKSVVLFPKFSDMVKNDRYYSAKNE